MVTTKVILQGGGGHATVVLDMLSSQGIVVLAVIDAKYSGDLLGVPRIKEYDTGIEPNAYVIVAIGDNAARKRVAEFTKHQFMNAIHSSAIISGHVKMGLGNMILHGTIIQAQTEIGNHVIINTGAQVDHHCVVEDYAHIAPRVVLCGNVKIGTGTLIGAGATVIPGKKIGRWATIGAGSVVTKDIPDFAVAVGNPARVIKINRV
ncbi:MAG TPA: acetyltransferase [Chryseolinea sp.]|nr:acetyltransferase [Chryseolinea sp.]